MVALHGDGAGVRDLVAHHVDHPGRVGAIADEVAQQRKVRSALGAGMRQHGLEGLAVAVDVGDDGEAHGVGSF